MPAKRDLAERFWEKVDKSGDCWLWTAGTDNHGYGQIAVNRRPIKAHRVAWMLTYLEDIAGCVVSHKCDNPPCVNPEHLFIGTQADNLRDCWGKKRHHHGENHANTKLCDVDVVLIRDLIDSGVKQRTIAKWFEVSEWIITKIKHRKTWAHL